VTHEPELTEPVDLCTPDGSRLNPAARGWSRMPLHRANLGDSGGRNKRWDYWAVLAGDVVVSAVYANVDYVGLADVWWADLTSGSCGGHGIVSDADAFVLPERPGTAPLRVDRDGLTIDIEDDDAGTHLCAQWAEADGRAGRLDVTAALRPGHESLNVVIPWSDELFNYTSKQQARAATGVLVVGDREIAIGAAAGDAWAVLDVGRGRWPAQITWNWGGGAGRVGDHVVGLQIGAKWTEGTGFTENGIIVDGRLTKLGAELQWEYDWDAPLQPWHVVDPGGQLDIVLSPRYDKFTHGAGGGTHQVFGTWSGRVETDDGVSLEFDDVQGFAEEARQDW
jgi:Domain of unknown function (DUF2804), N-terminal/Domain of unknown function (DUF2804), C-terminal